MMFGGTFGASGAEVVIEEFMARRGGLVSRCATRACAAARTAQDHKRASTATWDEHRRHGP